MNGNTIGWYWRGYVRRHTGILIVAFLLMSLEGGMFGLFSWMIRPMFDSVLIGGDRSALYWVGFVIMAIFLIRATTSFASKVLVAWVANKVTGRMQSDLTGHLMTLDSSYFQSHPPGTLIERVRGDCTAAQLLWNNVASALARDGIALISLFGVALMIDWVWTLIAVAGVPVLLLPMVAVQAWVRRTARAARAAAARLSTRLDEMFHGVNAIKLSGTEAQESARFAGEAQNFVRAEFRSESGQAAIPALMDVVAGLGFLGVLVYGGAQIIDGQKTVGEFMSFFTAIALIFEPLRRVGAVSASWAAARASLDRIREILAERPTILSPAMPKPLDVPARQADIRFDDVQFGYGDTPVLRGLSFTARAGETTAFVGPSGAGKSTVFNLLARLVEPTDGRILLADTPVDAMALDALRGLFSVVAQDALLFDETIRDNILMGADIPDARLADAVKAAHIDDFLPRLPQGLQTPAGPRGSALSGGQRQRVAIARALLRDRPILLLDEATSALDAASEAAVQDALARLAQGRTTLVIAHRLATIRDADKIIVMDQGRAIDQGTHDELLARGGLYATLYAMQFDKD